MAEFFIQCPTCKRYTKAKTGFFAKKNIPCICGSTINVKSERYASCECHQCGNQVIFDRTDADHARCPVCDKPLTVRADADHSKEFDCAECGVHLHTFTKDKFYTCPVCGCSNDVAARIALNKIRDEGNARTIQFTGQGNALVWKHPVENFAPGTRIIVNEGQVAVFMRDGKAMDMLTPGGYSIDAQSLPVMEQHGCISRSADAQITSKVYYIATTTIFGLKWGTEPKVNLIDPMTGMLVELGASGTFNIRVANARKLMGELVGTATDFSQNALMGSADDSKGLFRSLVKTQVKDHLANAIVDNHISVMELDAHLVELGDALCGKINERLEAYGLEITDFFVSRVLLPDDPNFRRAKEQFAANYLGVQEEKIRKNISQAADERMEQENRAAARRRIIDAENEAEILLIRQRAEAEAYRLKTTAEADAYRRQAAAEADEMQMKGYTYQQETARKVAMNTAEAMQSMGVMGEVATMGTMMGAMDSMAQMTRDTMKPALNNAVNAGRAAVTPGAWTCPQCGQMGITGKFCGECGCRKPEADNGWDCPQCGKKGITGKFCGECGCRKPEADLAWDCPQCGQKGITGKFCGECGCRKP